MSLVDFNLCFSCAYVFAGLPGVGIVFHKTLYSDARATSKLIFSGCGDLIKFAKAIKASYSTAGSEGGGTSCSQTGIHVSDGSWKGSVFD